MERKEDDDEEEQEEEKGAGENLPFVAALVDHLCNSPIQEDIRIFLTDHADELRAMELQPSYRRDVEDGVGMPLRLHDIWGSFLNVIQGSLEGFMVEENLSEGGFKTKVEEAMAKDQTGISTAFISALLASWEFDSFVNLVTNFMDELDNPDESSSSSSSEAGDEGGPPSATGEGEAKSDGAKRIRVQRCDEDGEKAWQRK